MYEVGWTERGSAVQAEQGRRAAGAVQEARRQAAWGRAAAEGQASWLAAQEAAVSPCSVPGARLAAGRRRGRQPPAPLRVPGGSRSHADDGAAGRLPDRA